MTVTLFIGAMSPITGIIAMLLALGFSIIYEFTRKKFGFLTFGEVLIGNKDKHDILNQTKKFSISRIPVFILMILTLAINGNILDGLSEGQVYSIGNIFLFGLLAGCSYFGMKNFMKNPELLPVFLIIAGLMLTGFAFKYSPKAQFTGDFMFKLYIGLSVVWIITGLIYKMKKVKTTNA